MRYKELFDFMHERHQIYLRRQRGEPKPWTKNKILQQYRFTNAYRELDRVTIWIREHWREPHILDQYMWFAMAVARYINWPETLNALGYPSSRERTWSAKRTCSVLNKRRNAGVQVFGGAYFLNSIGPKIESIVNDRLSVLWQNRTIITTKLEDVRSLEETYEVLKAQYGFGSFMAAQVVADLKYTPQFAGAYMHDWWTWAASGPGSKRGLNRLVDRPVNAPWKEKEWHATLLELRTKLLPLLEKAGMPKMHAQDVQGIGCCEWDKHERMRLGEGRPKSKYPGLPTKKDEAMNSNFRSLYGNPSNKR